MDPAIRPQDDLFGHVNGGWLDSAKIPADLPATGSFIQLRLDAEEQVGDILKDAAARAVSGEAPPGSNAQKMGDLFASFLDEERAEALGAEPLADDLAAIDAVTSATELAALLGTFERSGVAGVVGTYVDTDDRDSSRYLVNVTQGGLGLPDESYYREDTFAEIRKKYVAHVAAMLRLVGLNGDVDEAAQRVMALEARLASGHWDRVACRDVVKTYNLTSRRDLVAAAPSFDWAVWTAAMQAPDQAFDEVVVRQPSYLDTLAESLNSVPLEDWKVWLKWQVASAAAPYLSDAFVVENFDFYSGTLAGTEELRKRWKRGVALVDEALGEAVGEEYVARHFPPAAKARMDALVANLVEAYRRNIGKLDWMGPDTRRRALEKLDTFLPKIGYPDTWRDYSALKIDRGDLLGNVRRATAFETERQLRKVGQPVDRAEWLMNAQTVNAYYNPGTNEICFPAGILQPPFFDPDADPAYNYGGIGAVIGHEIGHGFDDQGSQYDGDGNLVDWWTDDDRARFTERADALIEQYGDFEPRQLPGRRVNGALTVGENIGDLGGLTIGLEAYRISLDGEESPVVDGMTGTQRVLVNWVLCWRGKRREQLELQLLAVDPHSPPEFRANIVRNIDEFHEAFETRPGDGLWLDPEHRVRIW
ncbi:MAG: peptidase M13 [Nocardioidaceae bacterium]|nr:peptidase M13 [Nocardioidaceae bacterium]